MNKLERKEILETAKKLAQKYTLFTPTLDMIEDIEKEVFEVTSTMRNKIIKEIWKITAKKCK